MKRLTKILLINWLYYAKQMIEVEDITFLTGKTGAGKSTVIDALQIILLGELNARNFNKAANESSQRTLDGYLRADIDTKSPKSRRGKDFSSYITCQFEDDQSGDRFVAGIVFDCRNDGSRREQFFIYNGEIPANCFLVDQQAMEIAALRSYLKTLPSANAIFYDSNKRYRDDLLAKWNVHNEQVCRMLKKAVSFRPIVDIQQFITENICDLPDVPDIEAMQQNIRDYKRHEQLAQRQEQKLSALTEINQLFREMQATIDRFQIQKFLTLWAQKEDLEHQIEKLNVSKQDCNDILAKAKTQNEELMQQAAQIEERKNNLIADRAQSDVFQEQTRLRSQEALLLREQRSLAEQINSMLLEVKKETQALSKICNDIVSWKSWDLLRPLQGAAHELLKCCQPLLSSTTEVFACPLTPFEAVQDAVQKFSALLRSVAYHLEEKMAMLHNELDQHDAALMKLNKNIKDYPKPLLALKERLEAELSTRYRRPIQVDILADVLEIAEGQEQWRGAAEGFLNTQKFYLLVNPSYYASALEIHDRLKHEQGKHSYGLVDIGKLREKEKLAPWDDSLARKIQTDHLLARDYVDFLLGRVVCCAHVSQLRMHRTAITEDGMVYQGYVARPIPKDRMEDAFIGRKAVALRIKRIREKVETLQDEIKLWKPIQEKLDVNKNREFVFTQRFLQEALQRQEDYIRGLEISSQLKQIEEKLSQMNLLWLADIDKEIERLEQELGAIRKTRDECLAERVRQEERLHRLEYETLPENYQRLTAQEDQLSENFSLPYQEREGMPRYAQELERLKRPAIVAKNFGDRLQQTIREMDQAKSKLIQARVGYVRNFQPCAFQIEVMNNDEFDAERKLLEESELPLYREKIKLARESALEQFQNDFLAKLRSSTEQVQTQVKNLNQALKKAHFGTDQYQFRVERNPDYAGYYDMIMAPELMDGEGGLFALSFQQKYGTLIEELFSRIATSDDLQTNARKQSELQQNIERYTDFRTYLRFDLETTDQNGNKQLLSQTLNMKSGGETQTPFYIAVLASFAQLYRINDHSSFGNTVRLVVFDEAFNKMDSDRIIESVRLLRKMKLQAIICTPPDKLSDIMPEADRTLLVCKDKYVMQVLPYSKEVVGTWSEE